MSVANRVLLAGDTKENKANIGVLRTFAHFQHSAH